MASKASRLSARVETVMTRKVVLILEDIPMAEARAVAIQCGHMVSRNDLMTAILEEVPV